MTETKTAADSLYFDLASYFYEEWKTRPEAKAIIAQAIEDAEARGYSKAYAAMVLAHNESSVLAQALEEINRLAWEDAELSDIRSITKHTLLNLSPATKAAMTVLAAAEALTAVDVHDAEKQWALVEACDKYERVMGEKQ